MKIIGIVLIILVGGVLLSLVSRGCQMADEAADVAQKELGAKALLKKYEWFKDAAAQLDAKRANLKAAEARMASLKAEYGHEPRTRWAREDREQYNLWETEVNGLVANYNSLAADYNAAMAKINWRFCNAGTLPAGADVVLPREFRNYVTGEAQ